MTGTKDRSFWTEKRTLALLAIVFAAAVLPLLLLGFYDCMGCDDYAYGAAGHRLWIESGSLGQVLGAAWAEVKTRWTTWQGTYSSIFMMCLNPGVFGEECYWVTPFLMLGALCAGVAALFWVLCRRYAGATRAQTGILTLTVLLLYLQTMWSPVDGLFWYNGSVHYLFMHSLFLVQVACMLAFLQERRRVRAAVLLALSSLLGVATGGANLLTGLQLCIFCVSFPLGVIALAKKRRGWFLWIPSLVSLAGFAVNALAPGNAMRGSFMEGYGSVKAILLSFYQGMMYTAFWLSVPLLFSLLFVTPFAVSMALRCRRRFFHPLPCAFFSFCVYCAMYTPNLYATGSGSPDRCMNIIQLEWYLLVFFNYVNALGWFSQRGRGRTEWALGKKDLLCTAGAAVLCILLLFTPDKNTYASVSAVRSLAIGEAAQYRLEWTGRLPALRDAAQTVATVPALQTKPHLLYRDDIGPEGSDSYWVNVAMSEFYGKEKIVMAEEGSGQ